MSRFVTIPFYPMKFHTSIILNSTCNGHKTANLNSFCIGFVMNKFDALLKKKHHSNQQNFWTKKKSFKCSTFLFRFFVWLLRSYDCKNSIKKNKQQQKNTTDWNFKIVDVFRFFCTKSCAICVWNECKSTCERTRFFLITFCVGVAILKLVTVKHTVCAATLQPKIKTRD